jgi:PhnB protein
MLGPTKKIIHIEMEIGDSVVMLSDAVMEPARVASLLLYVPDVDKVMAKAIKAGATAIMPVQDMFWGDRFGRFSDPFGNLWAIATHIEDVAPAEMKKRAKEAAKAMAA